MMVELAISALIAEGNTSPTSEQITTKAAELQAAVDAAVAPTQAELDQQATAQAQAVVDHGKVESYLKGLTPEQFEQERRLPFADQLVKANA